MVLTQLPEVPIQPLGMLVRVRRGAHLVLLEHQLKPRTMPSRFGGTYSGPTEWLCRVREKREHWNAVRQWPIAKVGPAEIEIVRSQGYAETLYVRTFAEVSDNLCHAGAIFGGFKQLWLAVGLDKLD